MTAGLPSFAPIPWPLVVVEARRVKGRRYRDYDTEDYLQDVAVRLLIARRWDAARGPAAVYVRMLARTVLREWMRRSARRHRLVAQPTPPQAGVKPIGEPRGSHLSTFARAGEKTLDRDAHP